MVRFNKHSSQKSSQNPQTLMLLAIGFVTGDPTISIGYPYVFHPGVQVTVTEPGDAKWIYMMLPLPKGSLITGIKVAHHRSGIQCNITHIRLVQQREPVTAEVIFDDRIEKDIPSLSVINSICHVVAEKSMMLKICMEFSNTDDMIEFGAVEIDYIAEYEKIITPDEGDKKRKEDAQIYRFNEKHAVKETQPTLVDLFFLPKKKKSISHNNRNPL